MLLTSPDDRSTRGLAEGDPLPPEDRVISAQASELDTLYRSYRGRLIRFFSRATSPDRAQDLCQQLFLRIAARTNLQPIESPRAYLDRSARHVAADHHRRQGRRTELFSADPAPDTIGGPDPSLAFEARDALRRIEAAIDKMKPRTREIFLAHRYDGLTYREIAGLTGLGVKTIEKHMSRAIAHIDRHCG